MTRHVGIALYDCFTALDCVGPYDVLSRLPDTRVHFLAAQRGVVRADAGLGIAVEAFSSLPSPDVLLVPGGMRLPGRNDEPELYEWVEGAHETSEWTTSVCTGSLVLARLGLLAGLAAATHWSETGSLASLGAVASARRVEIHGKVATAAGVSAGIDLALRLAERMEGREVARAIQLAIEYEPEPPFRVHSADAPSAMKELAGSLLEQSVVPRSGGAAAR
jgi:transcriptional regulator GlxA family with amidase domain